MPMTPERFAHTYVSEFVRLAVHDAHDWPEDLRMIPVEGGWHVEADIPTSAQRCWLDFDITEDEREFSVKNLLAMRSGTGNDRSSVYQWDARKRSWQLVHNDSN